MSDKVYSVNATEELQAHLKKVDQLLRAITTEMQKYQTLRYATYGHVGDVGHVEDLLTQAYEFVAETE